MKAPKLSSEATQLCSSRESNRPGPGLAGKKRLARRSGERPADICGRVGADQERTVPSPNEPSVANNVAEERNFY